jgi:threonine dehydrogenase-like Zn-dependent dehydrogenase
MIDCHPSVGSIVPTLLPEERDMDLLGKLVTEFADKLPSALDGWRNRIAEYRKGGKRVVIWGAGSKGVAFLTTLGLGEDAVELAVDINPHRRGQFMATTGQEIIGPEQLKEHTPDVVIVMNPIYKQEIEADLDRLGLTPEVLTT